MFTVNIKFYGKAAVEARKSSNICRVFEPTNSYIDTPVFTEGHAAVDAPVSPAVNPPEYAGYPKSILASNVEGWGKLGFEVDTVVGLPFPSGIHNINVTKIGEEKTDESTGAKYIEVEFKGEGYKDEIYFKTIAKELEPEGFVITVTEDEDPEPTEDEEDEGAEEENPAE